jgi:hypothetical protein
MTEQTPDVDKDFDAVAGIKRTARLGGIIFEVRPVGLHQTVKFYALQKKATNTKGEGIIKALAEILDLMDEIVVQDNEAHTPLSKSGVTVTMEQLRALMEFAASKTGDIEKVSEEKKSVAKRQKTEAK